MATKVNLSPNEESIKSAWIAGIQSIRQIARDHEVSPTWVKKLAVKHGWGDRPAPGVRPSVQSGVHPTRAVVVLGMAPERGETDRTEPEGAGATETIRKAARSDPKDLADDTLDVLARLRDELDAVTSHPGELEEMIEAYTKDDRDPRHRNAMMKAVSLPTRILAAKNLALALRTLQEAGPGKKEQAQRAAATAGVGSLWGDDLDVGIGRAN